MDCVAEVVYAEARGEGEAGMRAVTNVIYNRSKRRGKSPCIIVRQPNQFAKPRRIDRNSKAFRIAKRLSINPGRDNTNGATYFHNTSVRPKWSYNMKITLKLGNHIFYKR